MFIEYGSEIMAVCVVLFCVMFATLIHQHTKIKNLNKKLNNHMEYLNTKYYDSAYINTMHKNLERSYADLYKAVNTTLDDFHKYSDKNKEEIMKTYEYINKIGKDIVALDTRIKECENKFNANDCDDADTVTDIPVCEWIFPDENPDAKKIVGESYLVIGQIKDNNPNFPVQDSPVQTRMTVWDGSHFRVTLMDSIMEGVIQYYDKVYAYIRNPNPTDVMPKILSKIEKDGKLNDCMGHIFMH